MIRQRSSSILRDCSTVNACVVAHDMHDLLVTYPDGPERTLFVKELDFGLK